MADVIADTRRTIDLLRQVYAAALRTCNYTPEQSENLAADMLPYPLVTRLRERFDRMGRGYRVKNGCIEVKFNTSESSWTRVCPDLDEEYAIVHDLLTTPNETVPVPE